MPYMRVTAAVFLLGALTHCAEAFRSPSLGLTTLALTPPQARLERQAIFAAAAPQRDFGERVAAEARRYVGQRELDASGQRYAFDSVGLARAVFSNLGVDLFATPAASDPARSGVDIVYQYAAVHGQLHSLRVPEPGDIVFFGKTRDRDRDGQPDPLSHIGIVSQVLADGTANVITTTMTGVVTLPMNRRRPGELRDKEGHALNGRLLTALSPEPQPLTNLFYCFARVAK